MAYNKELPSDIILVSIYESGSSVYAIAEQYNTSYGTVLNHLKKTNCKMRSLSESQTLAYSNGRRKITVKTGENHPLWKGGLAKRDYRKVVKKEECDVCKSKTNLGIHHKNLDHYDNTEDNLQVLCVSCHMSIHKQAYWDAKKAGIETPKSNGAVGWIHKKEDNAK